MKILCLSNFYPPYQIGGYEMLCQEVVNALAQRGHTVTILAGTYGVDQPVVEGNLHRLLTLESDLYFYQPKQALNYPRVKQQNLEHLRRMVKETEPDVIFIWGMWSLSKELAAESEKLLPGRVVYYLANPWPIEPNMHQAYWDMPAKDPLRQVAKQAMRIPARVWLKEEWQRVPLQFQYAPCCSIALRDQLLDAHVPLQDATIVYEGIDLAAYLAQADQRAYRQPSDKLTLVYVGNIAEHKGVHTAIEALAKLPADKLKRVHLTILGSGHPHYEARLRNLVETNHLEEQVVFQKPIPRSELPAFLGKFDCLLLPSIWEEPLARIMQEGLACGMVVVGAATGGTKEIIRHNENGLLFPAADAASLATQIERLIDDPALRRKLGENGRQTAVEKFDLVQMVNELETYLQRVNAVALPI